MCRYRVLKVNAKRLQLWLARDKSVRASSIIQASQLLPNFFLPPIQKLSPFNRHRIIHNYRLTALHGRIVRARYRVPNSKTSLFCRKFRETNKGMYLAGDIAGLSRWKNSGEARVAGTVATFAHPFPHWNVNCEAFLDSPFPPLYYQYHCVCNISSLLIQFYVWTVAMFN